MTAGEIRARAEVMGVPAETIDGMSVWTVREAAATRDRPRARGRTAPCSSRRSRTASSGHSRSDPGAYRPDGELDQWRERDPIAVLAAQLASEGVDAARARRAEARGGGRA